MFQRSYPASTAYTYVSALGYSHRLAGFSDPTKVFWVTEMLKGYHKLGSRLDTRLPITLPILRRITEAVISISSSQYRAYLFHAMFTTAFLPFRALAKSLLVRVPLRTFGSVRLRGCWMVRGPRSGFAYNSTISNIRIIARPCGLPCRVGRIYAQCRA